MRKRLISFACLTLLITGLLPSTRSSANPASTSVESSKRVISMKLSQLDKKANLPYTGDIGFVSYLDTIARYAMWIDFLKLDSQRNDSLNIGAAELNQYIKRYEEALKLGNEKFKDKKLGDDNFNLPNDIRVEALTSEISLYLQQILDPIKAEYDKAPDEDARTKIKTKNKNLLKYLYRPIYGVQNELEEINSVIPTVSAGTGDINVNSNNLVDYRRVWEYNPNISALGYLTTDPVFRRLLEYAKEVSTLESGTIGNIALNSSDVLVEKFITNNDDKKELSTAYFAALATSSIYVPFQSHAGDQVFTDTFRALIDKDKKATDEIIDAYTQLKSYKKPLYYRETDSNGNGVGRGYMITLANLVEKVRDNKKIELSLHKGSIKMGEDTNSYEYYNGMNGAIGVGVVKSETNEDKENNSSEENSNNNNGTEAVDKTPERTEISQANVGDPVTNSEDLTEPVLRIGTFGTINLNTALYKNKDVIAANGYGANLKYYRTPETVILNNVFSKNEKVINSLNANNQLLFMNPFGDIVLADDTIIYPGSANFNFYNKGWAYYSNTATVMNFYPSNIITGSLSPDSQEAIFNSPPKDSIGQNIIGYNVNQNGQDAYDTEMEKFRRDPYTAAVFSLDTDHIKTGFTVTQGWDTRVIINGEVVELMNAMKVSYDSGGLLGGIKDWFNEQQSSYFRFYQPYPMKSDSFFPLNYKDKEGIEKAVRIISNNMYLIYMSDKDGQAMESPNDMIDDGFVITNVVLQASNGVTNSGGLLKSISSNASYIFDNQAKLLQKTAADLFEAELNDFGGVEGVIGIKTAYQDTFFGSILGFLRDYYLVVVIAVFLYILIQYMRNSQTFVASIILAALVAGGAYATINWLPIVVPNIYNVVVERMSEKLAYKSLMYKVEQYDQTYGESAKSDNTGRFSKRTTSVDLKTLSESEFNDLCDRQNLDKRKLLSGGAVILDATNGIYLEGKVIKLNVDRLFYTFPITGSAVDVGNGLKQYQLSADKMYSSNIDYYMPYYTIAKNFTDNLNSFARIYQLQRETIAYSGDMEKDSFFVKSFMVSIPFLSPGQYTNEDGSPLTEDPDETLMLMSLQEVFGNELDFLGIRNLLENPDQKSKDTSWYQTAEQNKLLNKKNIDATVKRVNMLAKEFMIDNYYNFQQMSDENIIKVVSLYATMQLNSGLSTPINSVNPITLNFEELSLKDVLTCTLVNDFALFTNSDINLATHITNEYGFLTTVGLIVSLVEIFIIVNLIKYLVPALYLLFLVLMLLKFRSTDTKFNLVKGYLVCTSFIFGAFLVFCGMLSLVELLAGNSFNAIIMIIVCTGILIALADVLLGIMKNFTELGYGEHGTFTNAVFNNTILKLPGIRNLADNFGRGSRKLYNSGLDAYEKYCQSAYDYYDDRNVSRVIKDHDRNYSNSKDRFNERF